MARRRHLKNAPIREALLDIRVVPASGASVESLASLQKRLATEYSESDEKRKGAFALKLDPKAQQIESTHIEAAQVGYVFSTKDRTRLVQASIDNFTQNLVGGYIDFETLAREARVNWEKYLEIYKPAAISRIALRYINDLPLPRNMEQFEDYLTAIPPIPPELPQTLSNFLYRFTMVNAPIGGYAIVNQIFQGQVDEAGVHVILDIDAVIEGQMDIAATDLWAKFAQLRQFKNDIFFGFITERLAERFE
jgi:uncharacterized protein (TIGR04255 family)